MTIHLTTLHIIPPTTLTNMKSWTIIKSVLYIFGILTKDEEESLPRLLVSLQTAFYCCVCQILYVCLFVCLIVFNATFNNISVISWLALLVKETGGPGENHQPVASYWQLYHILLYTSHWSRFERTTSVVIGIDSIGSCKSNYRTITATTAPKGFTRPF